LDLSQLTDNAGIFSCCRNGANPPIQCSIKLFKLISEMRPRHLTAAGFTQCWATGDPYPRHSSTMTRGAAACRGCSPHPLPRTGDPPVLM